MGFFRLGILLSGVFLLCSCAHPTVTTRTPADLLAAQVEKISEGVENVSEEMEQISDEMPEAYLGQAAKAGMVPGVAPVQEAPAAPPVVQQTRAPAFRSRDLVWTRIDSYDIRDPGLPAVRASLPPCPPNVFREEETGYHQSVKVFSLDDAGALNEGVLPDGSPCAVAAADALFPGTAGGGAVAASSGAGDLLQRIFFEYGSSSIGSVDRRNLSELAGSLAASSPVYSLNVVGHASKRVDGVQDPLRKKMINLEMAQKRANAVASALKTAGAKPAWVRAISKGDEEPNPEPGDKTQEAADRRAEVYMDR